jgi:exopolysaccharide biosynthesis polyprenyl glycosylphosphotransferase
MTSYTNSINIKKKKLLLLGDILLVFIAFFLASSLKEIAFGDFNVKLIMEKVDWMVILWMSLYPIIFYIFELYNQENFRKNLKLILYVISAILVATGIVALLSYLFIPHIVIGKIILLIHTILTILFIFFWRKLFENIFYNKNHTTNKMLFIGNSTIVNDIQSIVRSEWNLNPEGIAIIKEYSENPGTVSIDGTVTSKSIFDLVKDNEFKTVVVADNLRDSPLLKKQLLDLRFSGVTIYDAPHFYEVQTGKVPINYIKDSWFLFHNQGEVFNPTLYRKIKKVFDRVLALTGIILSFPVMVLSALAIKIFSKGPIFFKQDRLGQNEQPFTLIKFRTMINNAEEDTGPKWATGDDPRITKVGKVLRKTRIDELPQLFNVLKGEMSFVGPRPIRKHFADLLTKNTPFYRLRFVVKPGLTGWAQVKGNYADSVEDQQEKLEYDLYYIQNQSLLFDLFIILKTIQTVLFHRGQ